MPLSFSYSEVRPYWMLVRERRHLGSSKPSVWVAVASAAGITIVSVLAFVGYSDGSSVLAFSRGCIRHFDWVALILDQIKRPVMSVLSIG